MGKINSVFLFLGRILLLQIFTLSSLRQIMDFKATAEGMVHQGLVWYPPFLLGLAIVAQLGGSFLLLIGYRTRWGAAILSLFLIVVTYYYHTNFSDPQQSVQFMKNAAILGGLLTLFACGPGAISLDKN